MGASGQRSGIGSILFAGSALLAGCGSGGEPSAPLPQPAAPLVLVSAASPFADGCDGVPARGTLYANAEVEPFLQVNPLNPSNLVGAWQQDRWSGGGARGLMAGASFDGGLTWSAQPLPVSRCGGGTAAQGGGFERATDPWVAFAPDGAAYALALSFDGAVLQPGSASAMLVLRSADGGASWGAPTSLIVDGADAFNDKGAITADPRNADFVYAVWDRVVSDQQAPTYFARTIDGGLAWQAARAIYDPGTSSQTVGNLIAVLPGGALVDLFLQIDAAPDGSLSSALKIIRSADHGASWSAPVAIAADLAVGSRDPDTGARIRDGGGLGAIAVTPAGELLVVWQDARFSGGQRDGIVLARSADGGATWSAPALINGDPDAAAFTPSIAVLGDGTIGVTYYDLRHNTPDRATLPTDCWLLTSGDGVQWRERLVAGPFDLDRAPAGDGLFLGDYQGLAGAGQTFMPLFVRTNAGAANRTDVFTARIAAADAAAAAMAPAKALADGAFEITPEFRRRVHENLVQLTEDSRRPAGARARRAH